MVVQTSMEKGFIDMRDVSVEHKQAPPGEPSLLVAFFQKHHLDQKIFLTRQEHLSYPPVHRVIHQIRCPLARRPFW